ncbi:MAG: hypothetical protein IR160_12830 [Salinibacterium sp.]|nr:D-glucuronyl C5-epimerase family protein [Salinibacterium sp.]MBF0673458.1 hypothetical protein [Salinibacterium sp.]
MRRFTAAIATLGVAALLAGCTPNIPRIPDWAPDPSTGILELPDVLEAVEAEPDLFQPILKIAPSEQGLADEFEARLDEGHATYAVAAVLASWFRNGDTKTAQERTERMLERWDIRGKGQRASYGFAYKINGNALDPGWWSGMSDWTFPLLLTALAQETGSDEYAGLADELIAHARKSVVDGGSIWYENDECWISEYAWHGMSYEDESFVLNGHQYALAAMGIIAASTGDDELADLFVKCSISTVEKLPEYVDGNWFAYMLHERTIDPPHYVVFEISLFESLARLIGDRRYLDAIEERQSAIAGGYPISGTSDAGNSRLIFTQVAGPHPYLRDLYQVELECTDGSATEVYVLPSHPPTLEESFLDVQTELDLSATTCDIWSHEQGADRTLVAPEQAVQAATLPQRVDFGYSVQSDSNLQWNEEDSTFAISKLEPDDPKNDGTYRTNQARIGLVLAEGISLASDDGWPPQFAVQLTASTSVVSRVEISDGQKACLRNYPRVVGEADNLLLLSLPGFSDCDIDEIQTITLLLGRSTLEADDLTISDIDVYTFDGPAALRTHLSQHENLQIPGI